MTDTIRLGIDLYDRIKKSKEYREAVRDSLLREIRYNEEILANGIKSDFKMHGIYDNKNYFELLKTDIFDSLHLNFVSIKDVLKEEKLSNKTLNEIQKHSNGNFRKWLQNTTTNVELLEKVYHRIAIMKALSVVNMDKNIMSKQYVKYLLLLLRKGL